MIKVSKEEAKIIREKYPNAHIRRTMKQKSKRGHYYCEETRRIINLLRNIRQGRISESYGKVGNVI